MAERLDYEKKMLAVSRPVAFSYNKDARHFLVGDTTVGVEAIPRWGLRHQLAEGTTVEQVNELIAKEPMVHTFNKLIGLPRLAEFVRDNWSDELELETLDVMADVMPTLPEFHQPGRDHLGFGATRIDYEMGRVVLKVPGICACIGPDATDPSWGSQGWEEASIFSYDGHNIDRPIQRAALYAGLGHLAFRAKQAL